jgi:ParB family chromosome partitioning protein
MEYIGLSFNLNFDEVKKLLYHFRNVDSKSIALDSKKSESERERMESITQKLGNISVASLINRLKVFSLKELILDALKEGKVSYTAAVELNKIDDIQKIKNFIGTLASGQASIKDIKAYLKEQKSKSSSVHKAIKYSVEMRDNGITLSIDEKLNTAQVKKLEKFLSTL